MFAAVVLNVPLHAGNQILQLRRWFKVRKAGRLSGSYAGGILLAVSFVVLVLDLLTHRRQQNAVIDRPVRP